MSAPRPPVTASPRLAQQRARRAAGRTPQAPQVVTTPRPPVLVLGARPFAAEWLRTHRRSAQAVPAQHARGVLLAVGPQGASRSDVERAHVMHGRGVPVLVVTAGGDYAWSDVTWRTPGPGVCAPRAANAAAHSPARAAVLGALGWGHRPAPAPTSPRTASPAAPPATAPRPSASGGRSPGGPRCPFPRDTPERRAWAHLTKMGAATTPEAVAAEVQRQANVRQHRAHNREVAERLAAQDGKRAAQLVAQYVAEHGAGPSWGLLGQMLGWDDATRVQRSAALVQVQRAGWLTSTCGVPGSTRAGPAYRVAGETAP